ncbi:MAG: fused MFS/spermidine synthase [Candidatus Melainabacteria bacterium]|nr:fused MFS/spermidine synthase [Candidatus Melainabacteria bacterium]
MRIQSVDFRQVLMGYIFSVRLSAPASTNLLATLLFLSGAAALIYEVSWVRLLGLVLGNTTQATSSVLAVFLGGLALGAYLGGKLADRTQASLLVIYGALELGIACVAPLISYGLLVSPEVFVAIYRVLPAESIWFTVERIVAACLMLLVPTVLMGATLPVVTRFMSHHYANVAHYFSLLYGLNTAGAVAGSLATSFFGFPFLGVKGTIFFAAVLNLLAGVTALTVSRIANQASRATVHGQENKTWLSIAQVSTTKQHEDKQPTISNVLLSHRCLCFVAALVGFTALSYEILWVRLLRAYVSSSTYAFTFMVSTFLAGLVAGSFIYNMKLKSHGSFSTSPQEQLWFLAKSQYATAFLSAVALIILPGLLFMRGLLLLLSGTHEPQPIVSLLYESILASLIMFLPATLIGISFPTLGGIAASHTSKVGNAVGTIYAANTAGCIAGSLVAGLVLIPSIGSQMAFELTIGLSAATATLIGCFLNKSHRRQIVLAVPAVAFGLFVALMPRAYLETTFAALTSSKLISSSEDTIGRVMVVAYNSFKRLFVNGESYSSDVLTARRYMRVLGHLPVLLNKTPKNVLVVCFGIGTTAGAIITHPEVAHLDIVEISPAVLQHAKLFRATNYDVLNNPKVSCYLDDGRNYLLRTDKKYDVISFEPPPPCDAGVVSLYSQEFYVLLKNHLNPGGIVCQWMPMQLESATLWKMMLKSMAETFPEVTVWLPSTCEAIALGSLTPQKLSLQDLAKQINSSKAVRESLEEVGLEDPYALASTILLSGSHLRKYLANVKPVTDDRPSLEFFLPYAGKAILPMDLEPVASNVTDLLSSTSTLLPSEQERLALNQKVMHLSHLAATYLIAQNNVNGARRCLEQASSLVPTNRYFAWAAEHPQMR